MSNKTFKVFVDKMGGNPSASYIGNAGEIFYDPESTTLRISDGQTTGGLEVNRKSFGCFHKISNVTAQQADVAFSFDWFTQVDPHINNLGIRVESTAPTHVVFDHPGNYMILVEMSVKSISPQARDVFLWLRKNGQQEVPDSTFRVEIRGAATNKPLYQPLTKQWIVENVEAGDFFETRFAVTDITDISLEYLPAQTVPYVRPAAPSATLFVTQI